MGPVCETDNEDSSEHDGATDEFILEIFIEGILGFRHKIRKALTLMELNILRKENRTSLQQKANK